MEEIWKDIEGHNGIYQVSNFGRVKSLDRKIFNNGNHSFCNQKGKILSPVKDPGGYMVVGLHNSKIKKTSYCKVHRLVALAFCEGYEEGLEVNHKNSIRHDNNASNLEWVTRSGNMRHKFEQGYKMPSGEDSNTSKLKDDYLPIIYSLYDSGISQKIIAKAFNVSQSAISMVINNKTYKKGLINKNLAVEYEH